MFHSARPQTANKQDRGSGFAHFNLRISRPASKITPGHRGLRPSGEGYAAPAELRQRTGLFLRRAGNQVSRTTLTRNGLAVKSGRLWPIRERHQSAYSGKDFRSRTRRAAWRLTSAIYFQTIRYDLRHQRMKVKIRPKGHCRFNNSSSRLRRLSKNS